MLGLEIHHQADLWCAFAPVGLHVRSWCAQQVVTHDRRLEEIAMAGRERPVQLAAVGDHPGLIERCPELHPVVELAEEDRRVLRKPRGRIGIEPAAAVVERSEEHTSELQSQSNLVCRLLLEKNKT